MNRVPRLNLMKNIHLSRIKFYSICTVIDRSHFATIPSFAKMTFFAAAFRNSIFFSYGVWNFTRQGFYRHQKSNSASAPVSTDLTGKNIVITGKLIRFQSIENSSFFFEGGSSGLGLELTKECLKSGARVWVLCRDTEKARKSLVEQNGGNLFLVACDLSRPKDIQEFAQRFLGENPNISVDVLVTMNCRGSTTKVNDGSFR